MPQATRKVVALRSDTGGNVPENEVPATVKPWSALRTLGFVVGAIPLGIIGVPLFFVGAFALLAFHFIVCTGLLFAGYQLNVWDVIEQPVTMIDSMIRQFQAFIDREKKMTGDPLQRPVQR